MVMTKKMITVMVITVMVALLSSGPPFAALFTFVEGPQFHLDVVTGDDNAIGPYATFTVSNNGPASSAIAGIYFQDAAGLLNSFIAFDHAPNTIVNFTSGADPYGNSFDFSPNSYGFAAQTASGLDNTDHRINSDESLEIIFNLANNIGYWDVINSMKSGNLRVGLYVIDQDGKPVTYIDDTDPLHTPVPGAALLLGSGLTGLLYWRRRKQQQQLWGHDT